MPKTKARLLERLKQYQGCIAAVLALIVGFTSGLGFAYSRYMLIVERHVTEALGPYQSYFAAYSFAHQDEYDRALPHAAKAYEHWKLKPQSDHFAPVIDLYLDCLAFCEKPMEYLPAYRNVTSHFGKDIPCYGWHYDRIAVFHLRTGEPKKAIDTLADAIDSHVRIEKDPRRSAWSHYLLSLSHLALGDVNNAVREAILANKIDPSDYDVSFWSGGKSAFEQDYTAFEVLSMYPDARDCLSEYLSAVSDELVPP